MTDKQQPLVVAADTAGGEDPSRITRRLTDALSRSGIRPDRYTIWSGTAHVGVLRLPAQEMHAVLEHLLDPGSTKGRERS
ncbi:hypothetical protein [Nocardia sp. CC201C]|uniref:hypothetical protein n=1 Tax=Nocardia sp. CC201C TaxID=3044575 RepID=UPI0024A97D77|nr:hypothetical protein [Nocardia sp. CC201C]